MAKATTESKSSITKVTADEIQERLRRGESFTFIDARNEKAWSAAQAKLPNAMRIPAEEIEQHLAEIPRDRTVITYCT
jgi:rhodanese-related sulfurtransferase